MLHSAVAAVRVKPVRLRNDTMSTQPPTLQTPIEILQAALKKEKDAYHFYDTLLNSTTVVFLAGAAGTAPR